MNAPFGGAAHAFCHADARDGLRAFVGAGEKARLAYLDPPFLTGKDFGAYQDNEARAQWLDTMRETLKLLREALTRDGSLYLHVDYRLSAHARLLLDEVFGEKNFRNEIIWAYQSGGRSRTHFSRKHDVIYLYANGPKMYLDLSAVSVPRGEARQNHMKRGTDEDGRAFSSIRSGGKEYRYYDDEPVPPGDVWTDISHLQQKDPERVGYPTQKPLKLLERIVLASSAPGDIVMDPFCGSGTTLVAAHRLARRGFGIDRSPEAKLAVEKRMRGSNCAIVDIEGA